MTDCVFCDIVAGQCPSSRIYEDDRVLALLTIGPVNPGHAMVIPKTHATYMKEMDEETGAHLFRITMRVAQAIRESGVKCEGINLFLADGEAAFQEVFDLHMHVFPRYAGDPFQVDANWDNKPDRDELDRIAAKIADSYKNLWSEVS